MNKSISIMGRYFVARSNPRHSHVWSVYDKQGHYIETFGGGEEAARARIAALDLKEEAFPLLAA